MKKTGLAFELVGFVLTGLAIGAVLDHIWETGYAQAGGVVIAFILWLFVIWKHFK